MIEPLRLSFEVACDATSAFAIWTERASAWWPKQHTVVGPNATRVEIEHGGWERLGPDQGSTWRDINVGGWQGVLPDYTAACARAASSNTRGRR